jgi:hypothetical protein
LIFSLQLRKITENLSLNIRKALSETGVNEPRLVVMDTAGDGTDWPAILYRLGFTSVDAVNPR